MIEEEMFYGRLVLSFVVALVISFIMTPVAIKLAPKIGAMDVPKDVRRMHTKAMPRFGGLAIYLGTSISILVFLGYTPRMMYILLGGTLIYLLGVLDDLKDIPAKWKFLVEVGIAVLMYACHIRIAFISNFFGIGRTEFGTALTLIVTVIWIVGITNTVNIIDGLDGLASGLVSITRSMSGAELFPKSATRPSFTPSWIFFRLIYSRSQTAAMQPTFPNSSIKLQWTDENTAECERGFSIS